MSCDLSTAEAFPDPKSEAHSESIADPGTINHAGTFTLAPAAQPGAGHTDGERERCPLGVALRNSRDFGRGGWVAAPADRIGETTWFSSGKPSSRSSS